MKFNRMVRFLGWFAFGACSLQCGATKTELGSETNWSIRCEQTRDCGEGACTCGVCTKGCDADADCEGLTRAACATKGSESHAFQCAGVAEPEAGICLPRCERTRDCAEGQRCLAGSCVVDDDRPLDPGDGGAGDGGTSQGDDVEVVPVGSLTNELISEACSADLPELLPGCSVDMPSTWGIDCDGDAVPDYRAYDCVTRNAERPTDFAGDYDCMLDDETLRYWVTPDADGDGYGQGTPMCAGPVVPEGYLRLTVADTAMQDCNDDDPAIHPEATDTWGDGPDSDCDDSDHPRCSVLEAGDDFPLEIEHPSVGCEGVDLRFAAQVLATCGDRCLNHGALYGFVVNSGTQPSAESITLTWRDQDDNGGSLELTGSLDPRETSALFEIPFDLITEVTVTIDTNSDCDDTNNTFVFVNPTGDQVCLF